MIQLITVLSYVVFPISGYEGVFCHINTDECASQPCLNNGKCIDKINSFHCECPKGEDMNRKDSIINGLKETGSYPFSLF